MKKTVRIISRVLIMGALLSIPFLFRSPDISDRAGDFLRPALCLVTAQYEPVNALGAAEPAAQTPDAARAPRHAVDANEATWWSEGVDGPGPGARLEIDLGAPGVHVGRVRILPGEHNEAGGDYLGQPRPREVTIELLADGRAVTTATVELDDAHELQAFPIEGVTEPVSTVALQVDSVYGGQSGEAMALAEVVVERDACSG